MGVGDMFPVMPLFLMEGLHSKVPLEPAYMAAWESSPVALRIAVEDCVP